MFEQDLNLRRIENNRTHLQALEFEKPTPPSAARSIIFKLKESEKMFVAAP
jgi:hypothetical protein